MENRQVTLLPNLILQKKLLEPIVSQPLPTPKKEPPQAKRLFLASPHMSQEGYEEYYVKEAFDTNWVAPIGKNIDLFESTLAHTVGSKYAVAVTSGTAGLHLAVKNLGIQAGDIVFVQSLTFVATVNAVLYEGGIPVLIDSEKETWNMDPDLLEAAFEKYQPKAVIVVHLYGNAAQMERILEICDRHQVPVIEDAAESLGTYLNGKMTGTFGEYGVYSFNGNKIITTSGGGMLVSDNREGMKQALSLATQAKDAARYFQHSQVGFTYRMSNIVAGIGRGQLKVLMDRVHRKQEIYQKYVTGFADLTEVSMMPTHEGANNWLSCLTLNTDGVTPIMIMDILELENIESRRIWKPMHLQPLCEGFDFITNGVSDYLFAYGLCLPSDTKMTDNDVDRVIRIIRNIWSK